ncbi:shikimate 5-dehydrogenase [Glutamicibacter uratoxydans]|uniref:Shikimate 5-dehydrogenase n=1 Tax=Glutamicibacter uratoxydans TaxID=43667 RepID=A0A4Y4DQ27_GLUUR|nr:shikimate dehydrogenase [Glutamicibacter uratoxydans]GED04661.1 shikimate 5-dehydrogenase [Glutamicibacter uratoxydans]
MLQAAVLGKPIGHSKSPVLHRAAYQLLDAPISYQAIELDPSQAPEHAQRLRDGSWAGCSVTMPLKDVFVPLMDQVSERVQRLGALNTIVVRQDGSLFGENTDVAGLVGALHDFSVRQVLEPTVLGSGNTALAAIEACAALGARGVKLIVRDASRSARAVQLAAALGLEASVVQIDQLLAERDPLAGQQLVFSTLPPRAADSWVQALGPCEGVLLDVAYDPWPSALAAAWQGPVVSGLHMLVHQAVEQARLFTGIDFDADTRENVTNAMYNSLGLHRHG